MTHPNLEAQLDAYLDGELAPDDARALEAHIDACAECTRFRDTRLALRTAIRTRVPRFTAPRELHEDLRRRARSRRFRAGVVWRSLAIAASFAVVAIGAWRLGEQRGAGERLADEVLAVHIRSLMPAGGGGGGGGGGHLTDVQSSDQHTVKPWFNGKLDFSPPVYDFAGRGYPLLGGRLEYVGGRTVGALVYGRRQHVINVFLWPSDRAAAGAPSEQTRQGYHVLHWVTPSYSYWVVSDLGLAELQEFGGLITQADSAASR
jgi:anti-sigma factor (TIGR02949 family)